jgi:hypothetical protein
VCLLDVHLIHLSKDLTRDRYNINLIYEKLAETDSLQVFTYNSVKALIEVKWGYMQKRIVLFQLIPYVASMICFILYTTYDLENSLSVFKEDRVKESSALRILIWISMIYSGINEVRQCLISGYRQYFINGWNFMDIGIIILVAIAEGMHG